jgi:hypothetical protein
MEEKKFKAYIAGKLNSDAVGYIKNMHNMIKVAREVRNLGVSVYVPCNDFMEGLVDGSFDYRDYFDNSQPWLLSADFVVVCPNWENSEGTKKEIALARSVGIPVFFSIEELIYAIDHQSI